MKPKNSRKLRTYQDGSIKTSLELIVDGFRKILIWIATGGGKTAVMGEIVDRSTSKGNLVLTLVKRRDVVIQTRDAYKKWCGVDSSFIMGNSKGFDSTKLSQISSADTLPRRLNNPKFQFLKMAHVVIIDEAHDFTAPGYKRIVWWLEGYDPNLFTEPDFEKEKINFKKIYLGFSATPFRVGKKTHTFWDKVIKPIEMHELREQGFLTPIKVFAPKVIDTTGLRSSKGDYNQKELFERVSKLSVIGDTVELYRKYGEGKKAIAFCVNNEHSKMIVAAFNADGISAIACSAEHDEDERNEATEGMRSGKYQVLVNTGIWTTGFDFPMIEVMIGARPTESENLYCQMVGRVLRPFKICEKCNTELGGVDSCYVCGSTEFSYIKKYSILLDQGGNVSRHGMPYDIREPELDPSDIKARDKQLKPGTKTCPDCFLVTHSTERYCGGCGYDFVNNSEQKERSINEVEGELYEVDEEFLKGQKLMEIFQRYNQYKRVEMQRNMHEMWKYYKLYKDYGEDIFNFKKELSIRQDMVIAIRINELSSGIDKLKEGVKSVNNPKVYR